MAPREPRPRAGEVEGMRCRDFLAGMAVGSLLIADGFLLNGGSYWASTLCGLVAVTIMCRLVLK